MNRAASASAQILSVGLILLATGGSASLAFAGEQPSDAKAAQEADAILAERFKDGLPGAAAIVVRDGRVIFRKAYGLANLELGVPMRPEMVFQVGSVTKQFTSAAVLMLVEQGKINLDDDFRSYLPEYPDKGARITVEHLLTHTSGIKSYTDDSKWFAMWRQDLTPAEIIAITKDQPLDFPPGTKFLYNNTGYVILGAIIEKVTGQAYGEFIRKNIFEPLGMKSSHYGTNFGLVPNRAYGYSKDGQAIVNAPFLSMTQPFAAGSIESTVDDLAIWDAAVSSGKLLTRTSWDRMFTSYELAGGEAAHYGYGWDVEQFEGRRVYRHSGGIPGYMSEVLRMPDDRIYVALLTNSDASGVSTGFIATRLASAAGGIPFREPTPVTVDPRVLEQYVGVYQIDESSERYVRRDGDHITTQRTDGEPLAAYPYGQDEFFYKESYTRLRFTRDASGNVTGMVTTQGGISKVAPRTDKPVPSNADDRQKAP